MTDVHVAVQPGDGLVARVGYGVLLVLPGGAKEVTDGLVAAVRETCEGQASPGRTLARRVVGLISQADPDSVPPFGVAAPADQGGWAMILHQGVEAVVDRAGHSEQFSGYDAATWVDRLVSPGFASLALAPVGGATTAAFGPFDLEGGVVPGGGVTIRLEGAGAPDAPQPGTQAPAQAPAAGQPQAPAAGQPQPQPQPGASHEPQPQPQPQAPAAGQPQPQPGAPQPGQWGQQWPPDQPAWQPGAAPQAPAGPAPADGTGQAGGYSQPGGPQGQWPQPQPWGRAEAAAAPATEAPQPPQAPQAPPAQQFPQAPPQPPEEDEPPTLIQETAASAEGLPPQPQAAARAEPEAPAEDEPFESVLLTTVGEEARREALPVFGENTPKEEVVEDSDAPLVYGVMSPAGYFNHPDALYCAVTGVSMLHRTHVLVQRPRPPLGVVVADDGSTFTLDKDYVVGREPERDERVTSSQARPLKLDDPERSLSRVHADIRLVDWDVTIVDRGSANGTYVLPRGAQQWKRLVADTPEKIDPGTRIAFGKRVMTFESHHQINPAARS